MGLNILYPIQQVPAEYTLDSDPTTFNWGGTNAAAFAILIRTDVPGMYYKSGPSPNNWTAIGAGGAGADQPLVDLSVNNAGADWGFSGTAVMRTGGSANPAGAYNGGGTGNKSFLGVRGFDGLPMSALVSIETTWRNLLGGGGPFYNPVGPVTVVTPYLNLLVNFAPLVPGGDIRILVCATDQVSAPIRAAVGTYANPGGLNTLIFSWTELMSVIIVGSPANPTPGGVPPSVSIGGGTFDNAYSWAALKAANPTAILVDAFPAPTFAPTGDGGAPAGAILPAISLVSGDSGNVTKSGKHIVSLKINGTAVAL